MVHIMCTISIVHQIIAIAISATVGQTSVEGTVEFLFNKRKIRKVLAKSMDMFLRQIKIQLPVSHACLSDNCRLKPNIKCILLLLGVMKTGRA